MFQLTMNTVIIDPNEEESYLLLYFFPKN